ncbi:MAG: manganese efflux pump [Firmicutes bacterium]|uniref:Putative manganese efflux pump MntP n=1 Tax=Melghirimyces thermohalophilus TaxID=1236220 RepID=A0A1G6MBF6_9BACL|nr:manganese efflux pump [Melghirimyces thermohalophilus]MDA8353752.1 manganese efflux pump [Bacillota bacterium]SDC52657.1 Putative Mn2+ efflux pump MntP [Melghirimyces thermohalophilus]
MELSMPQWGQLFTLLMISVALGMDAFSLGIGVGMKGLGIPNILKISGTIGLFHFLMPLVGISMGQYLGQLVENIAVITGGGLLCALGVNMIWQAFRSGAGDDSFNIATTSGVMLFSLSVSLDSLSAGFSLGLFEADRILTVLLFGCVGGLMACFGMWLGRHVGGWVGDYGEVVGGMILITLGLRFLL